MIQSDVSKTIDAHGCQSRDLFVGSVVGGQPISHAALPRCHDAGN